jgi:hypothetical protein
MFGDTPAVTAFFDRLMHHSHLIEMRQVVLPRSVQRYRTAAEGNLLQIVNPSPHH